MKNLMLFSILFLLGITTITTTQAQTRQADSLALVMFHDSCCNTGCILLNWDFNQSMDNWRGVVLTNGRVTVLNASNKGLTGSLADWNLSALRWLFLDRNQLTGNIPNFSNTPALERLYLYNNQLTGNIPDFSNLPTLQRLFLYNNQLTGSIPNFSNTPALQLFPLYNNQLTGNIPDFSNIPALLELDLDNNQLTGNIPDFSNLPALLELGLDSNQLTGNIPNFSNIPALKFLYLHNNQLTGNIPNFSNIPALKWLRLEHNQLTGNIPDFSNISALGELNLHNNQLTGNIPDFSNLPALQELDLDNNQLTGNIPNFSNLPNLLSLPIHNNQLTGNIPNFSNSPALQHLSLENNQLTFENLLPNYANLNAQLTFHRFTYSPQDTIGVATVATPTIGSSYSIDLIIDDTVSTNVYYWYKDGVLIDSTLGVNEYTISNFQMVDAGVYSVQIKNTLVSVLNFPSKNLILDSHPITLRLSTSTTPIETQPLQVSPNPVQNMLYIQTQPVAADYTIQVINLQGQILENLTGNGNRLLMLPMAKYPAGIYIVRLQQGDKIWQEKVVKQ